MEVLELIGRLLFVAIFFVSAPRHVLRREGMAAYARSAGAPLPMLMVPLTGVLIGAGGILVAIGAWPDLGAALLVAFLLPAAYWMHAFWKESDPQMRANQQAQFMKNVSIAGGALALIGFYNLSSAGWHLTGPLFS
jgi:putative oxidoreductase